MVNLRCQPDEIYNSLGNRLLGKPMGVVLIGLTELERLTLTVGITILVAWNPELNKKEKQVEYQHSLFFASWMQCGQL